MADKKKTMVRASRPLLYESVFSDVVTEPSTGVKLKMDLANSVLHLTYKEQIVKVGHFPGFSRQRLPPLSKTGNAVKLGFNLTLNKLDSWKKRFFVLSEEKLEYFEKENSKVKGVINLIEILNIFPVKLTDLRKKNAHSVPVNPKRPVGRENTLALVSRDRTWYMSFETFAIRQEWEDALANNILSLSTVPARLEIMSNCIIRGMKKFNNVNLPKEGFSSFVHQLFPNQKIDRKIRNSAVAAPTVSPNPTNEGHKPQHKSCAITKLTEPITDIYDLGKIIGRGTYAVVRTAVHKKSGEEVAVKCIDKSKIQPEELEVLHREIDIMSKLKHKNIIKFLGSFESEEMLYLVLEYAQGGELFDAIIERGQFSEKDSANITRQILKAINYCHQQNIAHRDLKPENLLLANKDSLVIKVADWGLSKEFGSGQALQTACGTPDYIAPEIVLGEEYGQEVDIWSIGIISYVLMCGYPPFSDESTKKLFEQIIVGEFDFPSPEWDNVSQDAKDFIKKLLVTEPKERITAKEALEEPWLDDSKPHKTLQRGDTLNLKKFAQYRLQYKKNIGKATDNDSVLAVDNNNNNNDDDEN